MELTDFLLARIAEDEALASAVGPEPTVRTSDAAVTAFLEVWHPDRVLAECEAKRRIVDWHRLVDGLDDDDNPVRGCPNCIASGAVAPYLIAGPCLTIRLLALPYADHKDYREEWRP